MEPAEVCILVADVTASVTLYESLGDTEAFRAITRTLDALRADVARCDGEVIQSRGDDILCVFDEPAAAAGAAQRMLDASASGASLHLALHHGAVIRARQSIFGDAVNVSYRLASVANDGEALASGAFAERLPVWMQGALTPLQTFSFKGRTQPVEVFSLGGMRAGEATMLPASMRAPAPVASAGLRLRLSWGGGTTEIGEAESLSVGRAEECDLVVAQPWISRRHAVLHVRDGAAGIVDRSTHGSWLTTGDAAEMLVRRRSAPLIGSGLIALGSEAAAPGAEIIAYEVLPAG
jgi:adenylate cyclase